MAMILCVYRYSVHEFSTIRKEDDLEHFCGGGAETHNFGLHHCTLYSYSSEQRLTKFN